MSEVPDPFAVAIHTLLNEVFSAVQRGEVAALHIATVSKAGACTYGIRFCGGVPALIDMQSTLAASCGVIQEKIEEMTTPPAGEDDPEEDAEAGPRPAFH